MAKRPSSAAETDFPSALDPNAEADLPPPGAELDDSVPRLSADDGQGGGGPPAELDDAGFQSAIAPDPEVESDGAAAAGDAAPATDTASSGPGAGPSTPPRPNISGLTAEQVEYYANLGMEAEAVRRANGPYGDPNYVPVQPRREQPATTATRERPAPAAGQPAEQPDPEFDALSRRIRRDSGLDELLENTRQIVAQNRQGEVQRYENSVRERAAAILDDFCKTNSFASVDEDVAADTREIIMSRVEARLNAERNGQVADRINWNEAIARDAVQIARDKAAQWAKREARRTQQRTDVATKTRSTAGGITPPPGRPKPKTSADRSREMESNLKNMGWRS